VVGLDSRRIFSRMDRLKNTSWHIAAGFALGCLGCALNVSAATIQVEDARGDSLVLAEPAQNIISLAPHITEMLFAIGAGDRLIARDRFSNYPEAALARPEISDAFNINEELLLILKPDLAIGWLSGNPAQIIRKIEQRGIPLLLLEPEGLASIADDLRRLGLVTGQVTAANDAAENFLAALAQATPDRHRSELDVFYQIVAEPLYTINGKHLISRLISRCGGLNIFADVPILAPQVNREAVITANPQVILAGETATNKADLSHWQRWTSIAAVENEQLITINADWVTRPGPRVVLGLQQICGVLETARRAYE